MIKVNQCLKCGCSMFKFYDNNLNDEERVASIKYEKCGNQEEMIYPKELENEDKFNKLALKWNKHNNSGDEN